MKVILTEKVTQILSTGIITSFGAFAQYLYYISKGRPFKWSMLIINLILGFFLGNVVGSFLAPEMLGRDGVLLIAGFGVWHILEILENQGWKLIIKKLGLKSGKESCEKCEESKKK